MSEPLFTDDDVERAQRAGGTYVIRNLVDDEDNEDVFEWHPCPDCPTGGARCACSGVPALNTELTRFILDAVLPAIRKRWLTELADDVPWGLSSTQYGSTPPRSEVTGWLRRKAEEVQP